MTKAAQAQTRSSGFFATFVQHIAATGMHVRLPLPSKLLLLGLAKRCGTTDGDGEASQREDFRSSVCFAGGGLAMDSVLDRGGVGHCSS